MYENVRLLDERDDLSHLGYDGLVGAAHHDGVHHPDRLVLHQPGGEPGQGGGEQSVSEQIVSSLRPLTQCGVPAVY